MTYQETAPKKSPLRRKRPSAILFLGDENRACGAYKNTRSATDAFFGVDYRLRIDHRYCFDRADSCAFAAGDTLRRIEHGKTRDIEFGAGGVELSIDWIDNFNRTNLLANAAGNALPRVDNGFSILHCNSLCWAVNRAFAATDTFFGVHSVEQNASDRKGYYCE